MFKGKVALLLGALCMIAAGSTSSWAQSASASASGDSTSTSTSTSGGGYSGTIPRTDVAKYAKSGATKDISNDITVNDINICNEEGVTCKNFQADTLEAEIRCDGSSASLSTGGWEKKPSSKKCLNTISICYNEGLPSEKCYDFNKSDSDRPNIIAEFTPYAHSGTRFSKCLSSSEAGTDKTADTYYKEYCLWGTEAAGHGEGGTWASENYLEKRTFGSINGNGSSAGITGDTGDDMLKISDGAEGFIEYVDAGVDDAVGLKWVSRNGGATAQDMMVPMGPRGTFKDYRDFLNNPPPGASVDDACYAVKANLTCADMEAQIPATCGSFALQNFLFRPTGNVDDPGLCAVGTASGTTLDSSGGLSYSWTCTKS